MVCRKADDSEDGDKIESSSSESSFNIDSPDLSFGLDFFFSMLCLFFSAFSCVLSVTGNVSFLCVRNVLTVARHQKVVLLFAGVAP